MGTIPTATVANPATTVKLRNIKKSEVTLEIVEHHHFNISWRFTPVSTSKSPKQVVKVFTVKDKSIAILHPVPWKTDLERGMYVADGVTVVVDNSGRSGSRIGIAKLTKSATDAVLYNEVTKRHLVV